MNSIDSSKIISLFDINKDEFKKFVLENIRYFNANNWITFINCTELIYEDIKSNFIFYKEVYKEAKNININKLKFSDKTLIQSFISICEDIELNN